MLRLKGTRRASHKHVKTEFARKKAGQATYYQNSSFNACCVHPHLPAGFVESSAPCPEMMPPYG
jgi:hypothetical protein